MKVQPAKRRVRSILLQSTPVQYCIVMLGAASFDDMQHIAFATSKRRAGRDEAQKKKTEAEQAGREKFHGQRRYYMECSDPMRERQSLFKEKDEERQREDRERESEREIEGEREKRSRHTRAAHNSAHPGPDSNRKVRKCNGTSNVVSCLIDYGQHG